MSFARFFIIAIALALAVPAGAESVYRWVDEDGNVVYSDRQPEGQAERMWIESEGPLTRPDESAEGEQSGDPEKCTKWTKRLTSLKNSDEVYRQQPDGSQEILTAEERELEIERTQLAVDRYCAGEEGR